MGDDDEGRKKKQRLILIRRQCWWSFWVIGTLAAAVTSVEGQSQGIPVAGLFCISNCATCPVICSPPSSYPPPPVQYSPPLQQSYYPSPPQLPTYYYSYPPPPPPPPSETYLNVPSAMTSPPQGVSSYIPSPTQGYSYPYYFFYASHAPQLCSSHLLFLLLFLIFLF